MNDMSPVIVPKSDQISSDDFLAGPRTYTIEAIDIKPGTEQPVSIFMAGEPRAWRPCKSMSRCLVAAWGPDANVYKGRSVTLYRDPKVKWGGMEVGGIRVSHMSHIDREMLLQLTATKGKRAPHIVKPLAAATTDKSAGKPDPATTWATAYIGAVQVAADRVSLEQLANDKAVKLAELEAKRPDLHRRCVEALDARRVEFAPDHQEGRDTSDMGEGFAADDDLPEGF